MRWPVCAGLAPRPAMRLRKAWLLVLLLALTQLLAAASAGDAHEGALDTENAIEDEEEEEEEEGRYFFVQEKYRKGKARS